jgi:hypothetical protein
MLTRPAALAAVALAATLLGAALAPAQTTTPATAPTLGPAAEAGAAFWAELARALGNLVGVALATFLAWAGTWLRTKWGLEVAILGEDRARALAADFAARAEEEAARRLKETGIAMRSEEKIAEATAGLAKRLGSSQETAMRIVEAVLPRLALGATAALKAARSKLPTTPPSQAPQG